MLESSRAQIAESGGMAACVLPGSGGGRLEGWLRAVCDEQGQVMAFTLSIPEPLGADGTSRWEIGLDSADHGLWDWDIAADVVYRSERWTRMLGYSEQPLPNNLTALSGLIHPDDHAQVSAAVQAHLDGRTDTYVAEFRLRQHDGQWRWILTAAAWYRAPPTVARCAWSARIPTCIIINCSSSSCASSRPSSKKPSVLPAWAAGAGTP